MIQAIKIKDIVIKIPDIFYNNIVLKDTFDYVKDGNKIYFCSESKDIQIRLYNRSKLIIFNMTSKQWENLEVRTEGSKEFLSLSDYIAMVKMTITPNIGSIIEYNIGSLTESMVTTLAFSKKENRIRLDTLMIYKLS